MTIKTAAIYKLTSPSGKIYIGQTVDLVNRLLVYKRKGAIIRPITKAIYKYGFENFTVDILWSTIDMTNIKDILNEMERDFIYLYDCLNPEKGYNLNSGGNSYNLSQSTKDKIGNSNRGKNNNPSTKIINQYSKSGEFIKQWNGTMSIERELGIHHSNVSYACNGKLKTTGGYIFKYGKEGFYE